MNPNPIKTTTVELKPDALTREERKAIRRFLIKQLNWLEKQCLSFSVLAASGDSWSVAQYQQFKTYRGNVRHLLCLAGRTKRAGRRTGKRNRGG
jgi:hypothetical protein